MIKNFEEFKNDSQIVTEGKLLDRIYSSIEGAVAAYKVDKKTQKAIENEVNKNRRDYDLNTQLALSVDILLSRVMDFSKRFADGELTLEGQTTAEKPYQILYVLEPIEETISRIKKIVEKSEK